MSFLLLLLASLSAPAAAPRAEVSCQAVYRTLDGKNNTVERSAALPARAIFGDKLRHTLDFQGRRFVLTEDHGELFAQIIAPASLAQGLTARGAPDSHGGFHLAEVDGVTVYRLDCVRN